MAPWGFFSAQTWKNDRLENLFMLLMHFAGRPLTVAPSHGSMFYTQKKIKVLKFESTLGGSSLAKMKGMPIKEIMK